ncbi:MAG TPA: hypothetical protein VIC30_10625, partial [Orrella sp.]
KQEAVSARAKGSLWQSKTSQTPDINKNKRRLRSFEIVTGLESKENRELSCIDSEWVKPRGLG